MPLEPPKSQKAEDRPISFILDARGMAAEEMTLFIRPEEMTRTHQSRTSVNQTLGGAWIDSFGEGLESTTLSGTLGWRTDPSGLDGGDRLIKMRENTYHRWHQLRADAVDRGDDPNDVKLRFVDVLNDYSSVIVPQNFEIRRSKSQPLLAKYRISFISVGNSGPAGVITAANIAAAAQETKAQKFGLDSLFASLKKINEAINSARKFIDKNILGPVVGFLKMATSVFNAVHNTIQNAIGIADDLVNVATGIAQIGVTVFRTLAAVANIPSLIKSQLMRVAGAFTNIFCVLKNSLKKRETYEDYNALYGASNCSSTSGGLPPSRYADQNPFLAVAATSSSGIVVSASAASAITSLARRDIVAAPPSVNSIGATLATVNSGVAIA